MRIPLKLSFAGSFRLHTATVYQEALGVGNKLIPLRHSYCTLFQEMRGHPAGYGHARSITRVI